MYLPPPCVTARLSVLTQKLSPDFAVLTPGLQTSSPLSWQTSDVPDCSSVTTSLWEGEIARIATTVLHCPPLSGLFLFINTKISGDWRGLESSTGPRVWFQPETLPSVPSVVMGWTGLGSSSYLAPSCLSCLPPPGRCWQRLPPYL